MKDNYLLYIFLLSMLLFRSSLLNLTTNLANNLFVKNKDFEVELIQKQKEDLAYEYAMLLDFKNNININQDYTITNVIKNNYGFNNLIVSGNDYQVGDEVINEKGLVGLVSKIKGQTSEVKYIYNTNIVVSINNETGKIVGKDKENNLIIKEISNYNNISINDLVYSTYGTYIGKVIKIKYEILDNYLTVKTIPIELVNYVAIIKR